MAVTDSQAPFYRKSQGQEAQLAYLGRALMDNRHGLAWPWMAAPRRPLARPSATLRRRWSTGSRPIAAVLTSAGVHDSQVAIPLATITAQRVTHLYDLMDAAYCSPILHAHSQSLGHVPLIDHNPRKGEKIDFAPHDVQRFKERSTVERVNARLKDNFGAGRINVRGPAKVTAHLMFAVLALTADQLLRWVT